MQKSLKVSSLALACAMSATLILGGCGKKDKVEKGAKAGVAQITEKVVARKVDEAEANKVLAAFGLDKKSEGALQWASRDGKDGTYTFHDVAIANDTDNTLKIGALKLIGTHMEAETPSFDKVEFVDLSGTEEDGTVMTIGHISLIKPSPALSGALANMFQGADKPFNNVDGDLSFQAAKFSDVNIKDKEMSMVLKSLNMGEAKDKTGVLSLNGLTMDSTDDKNVHIRLDSIEVTGANLEKYKSMVSAVSKGDDAAADSIMKMKAAFNVYDPDFRHLQIKGLNADFDGLKVDLSSYMADAVEKGGKIIMTQKMSPLSLIPSKDSQDNGLQEFSKMLSSMGYDKVEFTAGGKTILDEASDSLKSDDTWFEMKDGFRLSYNFDINGYKEFAQKAAELSANGSSNPMSNMDMMKDLKFNKLRIAFKDNSIIDRSFKFAAAEKGGDPAALKSQAKATLGFMGMMAKDEAQQKLAGDLSSAITKLIDNGGTLVIDMNPTSPVSLSEIGTGQDTDISKLGISIHTE